MIFYYKRLFFLVKKGFMMEPKRKELLDDISIASLERMIPCFRPIIRRYRKGDTILTYDGSEQHFIAVLQHGSAKLEVLNAEGDIFRLESYEEGDVFGELFTLPLHANEYIVTAEDACRVIYVDYKHVITPCEHICHHHTQLISNLFVMTAQKTQELSLHLSILNQRSIREKLLSYLRFMRGSSGAQGDQEFSVPMSLTKLADYLCVDRAAMMREIKSLKDEGLLDSNQRAFRLYAG